MIYVYLRYMYIYGMTYDIYIYIYIYIVRLSVNVCPTFYLIHWTASILQCDINSVKYATTFKIIDAASILHVQ